MHYIRKYTYRISPQETRKKQGEEKNHTQHTSEQDMKERRNRSKSFPTYSMQTQTRTVYNLV